MAVFLLIFTSTQHIEASSEIVMVVCVPVGVYVVTVRASNLVSNKSSAMEFVVEKPVTGLSINASTECIQVASEVLFQAFVSSGTDVHFDWSFGDLESAVDAGDVSLSDSVLFCCC